jgi:hypothetical protein
LPPPAPLPEINASFIPDDHGVDSLARQIRVTGRAYPLFEIAQMVLAKPERHSVTFAVKRKPDNSIIQPLFSCALDDTLWLSDDEAVRHVLEKHFATFYQPERTQIEPPKGVYTFVAQCGMSGAILGPPNYHDYQNQLRRLHADRFSRMPFEAFKARVRIVKDEAVVKKWIEEQSWKTEYSCLNVPEPLKLPNREEVEKHFRQVHAGTIIKAVESVRLSGTQSRNIRDRQLQRLIRQRWEEQQRFPLQVATVLSQQFATRGLQFFKVNKTVTHVAVARPHFLDLEATPVSDNIRRIVDYISAHQKCTHRQLVKALVPQRPSAEPTPAAPAAPVAPTAPSPEGAPVTGAEGAEGAAAPATTTAAASTETTEAPAATRPVQAPKPAPDPEPSPEFTAVMTDLHWLVHQGHVIEFANGVLETAKRPVPRPPKPAAKGTAEAAAATVAEAAPETMTPAEMVATEVPSEPVDVSVAGDEPVATTDGNGDEASEASPEVSAEDPNRQANPNPPPEQS